MEVSNANHFRRVVKKGVSASIALATATVLSITASAETGNADFEDYRKEIALNSIEKIATESELLSVLSKLKLEVTEVSLSEEDIIRQNMKDAMENSVVEITEDDYYELCFMVFCESGFHSWEMNNACASAAINQAIQEEKTIHEILNIKGRFRNGNYTFRDYNDDGTYVRREVIQSDITQQIYDAVNHALLGYDVNSETIGGTIGFWAPNYCSDERNEYMYSHTSGLCQIENVVFYHEWVN